MIFSVSFSTCFSSLVYVSIPKGQTASGDLGLSDVTRNSWLPLASQLIRSACRDTLSRVFSQARGLYTTHHG
ncbi:hypothetical protein J6590_020141 [Homalodisca vitripennis]|nr:hypothetical protein J6590_078470 [Homalodisca vitripennis]KAG8327439.1 hypothetical protein J6590_020141 [Homalodisca vitripennis]